MLGSAIETAHRRELQCHRLHVIAQWCIDAFTAISRVPVDVVGLALAAERARATDTGDVRVGLLIPRADVAARTAVENVELGIDTLSVTC